MRSIRGKGVHGTILSLLLGSACFFCSVVADALPPGRAWAPVDTLTLPQFERLTGPRIEVDAAGIPVLFGAIRDPGGNKAARFDWAESTWAVSWFLGEGTAFLWPTLSPPDEPYLLWRGVDPDNRNYLFLARAPRDSVAAPDTVARVSVNANMYSAVVTSKRQWVVVSPTFRTSWRRFGRF